MNNVNMRKRNLLKDIKMTVIRNDEMSLCRNGAVNKLVVISIGLNHVKAVVGCDELGVRTLKNDFKNPVGDVEGHLTGTNLMVLLQDLISDTKSESTLLKGFPHGIVIAATGDRRKETIGVNDYTIHTYGVLRCSFSRASFFSLSHCPESHNSSSSSSNLLARYEDNTCFTSSSSSSDFMYWNIRSNCT